MEENSKDSLQTVMSYLRDVHTELEQHKNELLGASAALSPRCPASTAWCCWTGKWSYTASASIAHRQRPPRHLHGRRRPGRRRAVAARRSDALRHPPSRDDALLPPEPRRWDSPFPGRRHSGHDAHRQQPSSGKTSTCNWPSSRRTGSPAITIWRRSSAASPCGWKDKGEPRMKHG